MPATTANYVVSAHGAHPGGDGLEACRSTPNTEASFRVAKIQRRFEISDERMHIKEGPADIIIQHVLPRRRGDCVVGGLDQHHAEILIDKLRSDVLVLKPDDIVKELEPCRRLASRSLIV